MSDWLTPDEAAEYLRVSRATIYRFTEEGKLPYSTIEGGRGRRYAVDDLRKLVQEVRTKGQATHAALASRFGTIQAELSAAIEDLQQIYEGVGAGWGGRVRSPSYWTQIRNQASEQSTAHRALAVRDRMPIQQIFDEAWSAAARNGHRMQGGVQSPNTGYARCEECTAQLTVGHPPGGGDLELVVPEAAIRPCPAAVQEIVRSFSQWEIGAKHSPNPQVAASAGLEPPTPERAASLLSRLHDLQEKVTTSGRDHHGRPALNLRTSALAWLWEEWRDDILGERNGYRDVWDQPDDPLYGGGGRRTDSTPGPLGTNANQPSTEGGQHV